MNSVWIFDQFSMIFSSFRGSKFDDFGVVLRSKIPEKSVLGGLLGPRPILEVQKPSAAFVLGGQVGAVLGLSRLLAASWSLKRRLEASRGGLEPLFFPSQVPSLFRTSFCIDFGWTILSYSFSLDLAGCQVFVKFGTRRSGFLMPWNTSSTRDLDGLTSG